MSEAEILLDYYRKQVQTMRDKFPSWADKKYYGTSVHGQYPFYSKDYLDALKKWLDDYDQVFRLSPTSMKRDET